MTSARTATTAAVAAALGLRPATVQGYARNGRIPFDTTPGGHRRFDVDEVRAVLDLRRNTPAASPASMAIDGELERGKRGKTTALDGLRGAILRGDMVPGQRLVEAELVELLGVTRASARSAIDDLVADGLIERIHNKGARVRRVSVETAVEILECRRALEALIAAKAAERATDEDIARLRAHGELLSNAIRDGELTKYSALNHELHAMLADIAGQRTAADVIGRLNAQIVRHQFQLSQRPGWPKISLGEHLAIVDAVASRDPAAAEQAMRSHLADVITKLQSD
jgi:DNA-binding GntR family transcriptional regulator